ncbi:MAG: ABC transporter ATP-binding protein [Gammaproteobacteria bacterium]|nr:ABC transporter ATP-binding protein [Gammaproteobacteria bacterium]MDP2140153.1 ABC transporter ATP-binding protein [Gammaproteobacteria bacterium]MDP2347127.1 ABC transporter ATP-binding protein [Gammaproteobacteria bacterium]
MTSIHEYILETRAMDLSIAGRSLCKNLNLRITKGECIGVLGQNGTGKTTLLHTLLNFRQPQAGEVLLCGRPVSVWPRKELATTLGILFQNNSDDMPATVLETALLGRHPHLDSWQWESSADVALAQSALADMGIDSLAERDVTTLSGGERQRLAMATLLTQAPMLYLLDEPGNHLDIAFQSKSITLLRRQVIEKQLALCMATHDINLAARFCDQILLLMGDGKFLLGESHEILTPANLSKAYGCEIREVSYEGGRIFFSA